jgi:Flp pilus assembly protein TadG
MRTEDKARERSSRLSLQQGQAIVLIALLILVLFGMLGLAIDSGRAYVDRRDQQAAIDAAALAAGDWYQNYFDINNYAIPKAVALYQNNLHLYSGASSSSHPPSTTVGPFSLQQDNYTYNYSSAGYMLTIVATNNQFNGYQFVFTTTHTLPLAFIQIFGGSPTVSIQATATSIVFNQRQTPALLTLSTGNCATNLTGGAQLTVLGNIYTNGTACLTSGLHLSGSCYGAAGSQCSSAQYWCYNSSPGFIPYAPTCNGGDTLGSGYVPAPPLPDPGYTAPSVNSYQTVQSGPIPGNRGTYGELQPGVYNSPFHLTGGTAGCYFLAPGVYSWNGGYQSDANGSLLSNELRPPDEQLYSDPGHASLANPQFWNLNGTSCAGDFTLAMVSTPTGNGVAEKGPRNKLNQWGVELTSVRFDTFNDPGIAPNPCFTSPGCARESAPSECQLTPGVMTNNGSTGIDINITKNAPGAQYYNVYLNVNGCDGLQGNFAYYGRYLAPGWKDAGGVPPASGANPYLGGTPPASPDGSALNPWPSPTAITLGYSTLQPVNFATIMNFNHLGILYTPTQCSGTTRTQGCLPTDNEKQPQCFQSCPLAPGTLSQENAKMTLQYAPNTGGDLANENYCMPSPNPGVSTAPCQGAQITPGAVQFYLPPSQCLSQNSTGATYVFSGKQYNWIVIYAPPANVCPSPGNKLNGGSATQFIGTIYTPGSSWTINGGNRAPLAGQVICFSATIAGGATVGIDFNPNYGPAPPAARLVN